MFLKTLIYCYNGTLFSLLTYILSWNDIGFYLSSCKMIQVCRFFGLRVFLYGDDFNLNEKALLLTNHKSMYDIISMFYVSAHFHRLIGFCLKKQIGQMPVIGWWCKRMKFPVLDRNLNDINTLKSVSCNFPIVIYTE